MAQPSTATRSLLEISLGFLGALLVIPLLFKVIGGLFKGIFRFSVTRRLILDAALAGLTALLTREDVLNSLFGKKGTIGDGILKPQRKR